MFSGLYLLYVLDLIPGLRSRDHEGPWWRPARGRREVLGLCALAAAAPLLWILSDLLVTGKPLWSLTNTRHTASVLGRKSGIADVPEYIPRRIGEILRPPVLFGAALGGLLTLAWLRGRAMLAAVAGVIAVVVFAVFASVGLPINTRYAFLASAILCIFCGAGVFGWERLAPGDTRRRWWMAGGALVAALLLAYSPAQYRLAHPELTETRPPEQHRTEPARTRRQPRNQPCVRPGRRPEPRPDPPARAVPEDEPAEHRQRTGRPYPERRLRGPREPGGRTRLRPGSARPPPRRDRAAGIHRVELQRNVADLLALQAWRGRVRR